MTVTTLASTNFSGGTLQGGTYIINGTSAKSTLQIQSLGTQGGEITTIGAGTTLVLDGANSNVSFLDGGAKNALAINMNDGNLYLEGGYNDSVTGLAVNAGDVLIDPASSMTATLRYVQNAGITQVDGSLTAPIVLIGSGILEGDGTIDAANGLHIVGTTIQAGDSLNPISDPPGTLDIIGSLDLSVGTTLNEAISGSALADIGLLNVTGNVTIGGTAGVNVMLLNGFEPTTAANFVFLDYTGALNARDFFVMDPGAGPNGIFSIGYGSGDVFLSFTPNSPVPEPATFPALAGLLGCLVYGVRRRTGK
jgi:hypothetical protein